MVLRLFKTLRFAYRSPSFMKSPISLLSCFLPPLFYSTCSNPPEQSYLGCVINIHSYENKFFYEEKRNLNMQKHSFWSYGQGSDCSSNKGNLGLSEAVVSGIGRQTWGGMGRFTAIDGHLPTQHSALWGGPTWGHQSLRRWSGRQLVSPAWVWTAGDGLVSMETALSSLLEAPSNGVLAARAAEGALKDTSSLLVFLVVTMSNNTWAGLSPYS